jgi:hypothetical protein
MKKIDSMKNTLISKIMTGSLMAKWLPRPNVSNAQKKVWAETLRKHLRLSPKEYRKLLVENSDTVEQLMCSNAWSQIDYSKVPSKAMSDLMKAFKKHDGVRFAEYLESVEKGTETINAGAVYPYDIVKNLRFGDPKGASVQWNALPNYMEGNKEILIPVVDVSGSMDCPAGNNANISCMDVAISLGLYISERNVGLFKDAFITFSTDPKLQVVSGNLYDRYKQMKSSDWQMSTDIQKVFKLILDNAKRCSVPESEMPTMILILSDMEFDRGVGGYEDSTAQEMINSMYENSGYKVPKIVYWNIHSKSDNSPVRFDERGTALVSGFSPSILKNILGGKDIDPISIMLSTINSERYSSVRV